VVRADARTGQRHRVLAFGTLLHPALAAAEKLDATVADMRFAKPLDEALVLELARTHDALVTVEEGCVMPAAPAGGGRCLAEAGWRAAAAPGPARRLHRAWRPRPSCWPVRPGRRRHRASIRQRFCRGRAGASTAAADHSPR
jgi:hypothetical protein